MIDFSKVTIDPSWALKVPPAIAMRRLALPLCVVDGMLVVAMADPGDTQTLSAISRATQKAVQGEKADPAELRSHLLRVYGDIRSAPSPIAANDPVALVDSLLRAATLRRASDIHFDPERDGVRVRLRVDGQLEDFMRIPQELQAPLCSRLKVMAGLDIAERRAPQDGGFVWRMPSGVASGPFDIRVATLPVRYGERLTLRLLESGRDRRTLDALGLSAKHRAIFDKVLASPHGLVLMTGPTGSGKTTTLFAAIRELLSREPLNILTVEDPIEYEIEGVSQVEVDSSDKVNFSKALRSLLRHDPDVIMIGEIRDSESLDTAVKAALTGHLVLSTLHTNDAVGAVARLSDMGLAAHLIAATLRISAAQRLVRTLCPDCREACELTEADARLLGDSSLAGQTAYRPHGCLACAGRGFLGRTGLFEMMAPDQEIASLIASGAKESDLLAALRQKGMRMLVEDAAEKVLSGVTSFHEAIRATGGAAFVR